MLKPAGKQNAPVVQATWAVPKITMSGTSEGWPMGAAIEAIERQNGLVDDAERV